MTTAAAATGMEAQTAMELNDTQYEFVNSNAVETYMIGGYGLGKSFALGLLAYEAAKVAKGSVTLIGSPTYDTLRNSTLRQIITECWQDKLGLKEGVSYVINQMPPDHWGVEPYSELSNVRVVTWRNGSYTILDTLENYKKHEGSKYDRILIDEFQNVTPDARKTLIARLRGDKLNAVGQRNQIYYALTPPKDASAFAYLLLLLEELKPPYLKVTRGSTYLNRKNLPADYIDNLIAGLDELSVQRYVHGLMIDDRTGRFAYSFKEENHVVPRLKLIPDIPIQLWFDFNIGYMATLVVQCGEDWLHVIDEFVPEDNVDIIKRAEYINNSPYAEYLDAATIIGDPAKGRSGLDSKMDYYVSLMRDLNLRKEQIKVRRTHPFIEDSRVLINTMFARLPQLKIAAKCKWLQRDLKFCMKGKDGGLDKSDTTLTHYLDAFRYGADINFIKMLAVRQSQRN